MSEYFNRYRLASGLMPFPVFDRVRLNRTGRCKVITGKYAGEYVEHSEQRGWVFKRTVKEWVMVGNIFEHEERIYDCKQGEE